MRNSAPPHPVMRRLRRDERGVALIEFAISLPVLLILCMFGLEAANLALTHLRISQIAMLVADNASRVRTSIAVSYTHLTLPTIYSV